MISAVLVVVDMGFTGGGLTGGWGGGIMGDCWAGGAVVVKGVTGGKGLVTGMLGCELEGGNEAMHLGDKGRDAGLAVY